MKKYCHYHPTSPAIWHCNACQLYFGKLSMPDGDEKRQQGNCPHCTKPMVFLEKRHEMQPFWSTLGKFFRKPLNTDPLLLILLSGLMATAMNINPIVALLLSAALSILVTNYGLQVAQHCNKSTRSSSGSSARSESVPGITSALDFKQVKSSILMTAVLWISIIPIFFLGFLSPLTAALYLLLSCSVLPSVLLMLMHNDSRPASRRVKAPSWMKIIKKMRGSYLALIAFFLLVFLSSVIVIDTSKDFLPEYGFAPLASAISAYALIALFATLGYVHARYESFTASAEAQVRESDDESIPSNSALRIDADLDIAVKDGNYERALALLESNIKGKRSDLRVHQLYSLLFESKDLKRLERYNHLFFELLLGRGQKLAAYELLELLRHGKDTFRIRDISLRLSLAEAFHEMKEYKLVLWLAQDAHKQFEPNNELAKLYTLCAETILSKSKTPDKARGYLLYLIEYFPESEFSEHAASMLKQLDH